MTREQNAWQDVVRFEFGSRAEAEDIVMTALSRRVQRTRIAESTGVRAERARTSWPRFFTSAWPSDLADGQPKGVDF